MKKLIFLFLTLILTLYTYAEKGNDYVDVSMISEFDNVTPGMEYWIGAHFKIEKDWHIYWKNAGDAGLPTKIEWETPKGIEIGDLHWPYPKRMPFAGMANFGYENEVVLLAKVKIAEDIDPDDYDIKAKIEWLVCKEKCYPGKKEVEFSINVVDGNQKLNIPEQKIIETAFVDLPTTQSDWLFRSEIHADRIFLDMKKPDWFDGSIKDIKFFPDETGLYKHGADLKVDEADFGYRVYLELDNFREGDPEQIVGVAVIKNGWDKKGKFKAIRLNIPISNIDMKQ